MKPNQNAEIAVQRGASRPRSAPPGPAMILFRRYRTYDYFDGSSSRDQFCKLETTQLVVGEWRRNYASRRRAAAALLILT
ncbi:hypothetical protein EVAR_89162_1 [Eumeta japonica]|uniref:Uncharacterized protein n=1 Tax=Eumeta variegata TaxID=151549 RepID=A0A4C1Z2C9_EUMVA|nr:hypothetical protein EVAR_89162_1 [Eumeta japonica]